MKRHNTKSVKGEYKKLLRKLLIEMGEDPVRDGLKETPDRVLRMYDELMSGYGQDPASVMKSFEGNGHDDLVTVVDIDFYSLCEHHMIPFFGKVHIGYLPNGRILGLSKFARLTDIFAKRLQVQERLTRQILDCIVEYMHPKGVIVHIEAEHMCMSMRGVKRKGAITKSTAISGEFESNPILVDRFFQHLTKKGE
jgi:GTP cyclohydrolase I